MKYFNSFVSILICVVAASPQSVYPAGRAPLNLFNIGDSIGVGEAANNTIGAENRGSVWSTGYDGADVVDSLNERFEQRCPADYIENDNSTETIYNHAVSGADMADFASQAASVISAAGATAQGEAGMVSVLLGANDMCASSLESITSPELFESRFRSGLDVLAASAVTQDASIQVSGIPAIYWLWTARRQSGLCSLIWSFGSVCQALLQSPADDCGSGDSHLQPDVIQEDDGENCVRRKDFHALIRDTYNPILANVLQEYVADGSLPKAYLITTMAKH